MMDASNNSVSGFVCSAPGADFDPDPEDAGGVYAIAVEPDGVHGRTKLPCDSPMYVKIHPSGHFVYVTHAVDGGAISSYRVDGADIEKLNEQPTGGDVPLYISIDATLNYLFVANYDGRTISVLPIEDDGRLGSDVQTIEHEGETADPDGQPRPHSIEPGPNNEFVYVPDLGLDRIVGYQFDADTGLLEPDEDLSVDVPDGVGPRHLEFHPNERYLYVMTEFDATLMSFEHDAETGELTHLETVPTMPDGFTGTEWGGDVHVHPSGEWVFVTNRAHGSVARYEIDPETGRLHGLANEMNVDCPRHITTDPSGERVLVANQGGDSVAGFAFDQNSGELTLLDRDISIPEPVCVELFDEYA